MAVPTAKHELTCTFSNAAMVDPVHAFMGCIIRAERGREGVMEYLRLFSGPCTRLYGVGIIPAERGREGGGIEYLRLFTGISSDSWSASQLAIFLEYLYL